MRKVLRVLWVLVLSAPATTTSTLVRVLHSGGLRGVERCVAGVATADAAVAPAGEDCRRGGRGGVMLLLLLLLLLLRLLRYCCG